MLKKGQSILEYAILFAIIIAALVVMQVYVKRAYQGRLKHESDSVGDQYSPGHTTGVSNVVTTSNSVTYTGGETNASDMAGVISGTTEIEQGVSVTVSKSATSSNSSETIDSLGAEKLYTKP